MTDNTIVIREEINILYDGIVGYIENAHNNVLRSINTEMVKAYWLIGKDIVEIEQSGRIRAEYGKAVVEQVSIKLQHKYKKGFGVKTLWDARKFYLVFQGVKEKQKMNAVRAESDCPKFNLNLSWTHYRLLMRISNSTMRKFYEHEAIANAWSARELERQISSLLYERLLKSKDKKGLLADVNKEQELMQPSDVIKDPVVLDFLNIPGSHKIVESKLEQALIDNMQHFLLELGRGFAFIGRQKRITLEGDHFYIDLVFYHAILNCYIIFDIKTKKLTHGDLGQMQLYVNYYDQEIKKDSDSSTIGLVLCAEKNNTMVKYQLGDKAKQIFASKYQFALPTEEELEAEVRREMKEIKYKLKNNKKIKTR